MRRLALTIFLLSLLALMGSACMPSSHIAVSTPSSATRVSGTTQDSTRKNKSDSLKTVSTPRPDTAALSRAAHLMLSACDNYLSVNPQSLKVPEVLGLKASVYYNNKKFSSARTMYEKIVSDFPKSSDAVTSVRMIAQSYYEEKDFDKAQSWYRKLRDIAGDGGDKSEAITRIAESVFKMGESLENAQKFKAASEQYERVALEFPDAKIADISLYNAGLCCEKIAEWQRAILMFERISKKYHSSKLLVKAWFRSAKSYEKLLSWTNAGEMYLRVVASFPQSDLAPAALYNAGFCFENANQLVEAAATFEKLPQLYPSAEDAADVLFKAGEIYGKLKDWPSVTRVNQEFTKRFGNDLNRVVQALCMVGVALYMQKKSDDAVVQLEKAIATYTQLKNPSTANKYYAANAQFTIAEIAHEAMSDIALLQPDDLYKKLLKQKADYLARGAKAYSKVVAYGVSEWTTRSVFQIGQSYEDFALGVVRQQRPTVPTLEGRFAWELGIAKALDEYYIDNALHYHEQNVKLGIKEKLEDKYILASRQKLTYLPYAAGANYLALANIFDKVADAQKLDGFALIGKKLEMLQKIAPYQERAIALFLMCLEKGSSYQQNDEMYAKAATEVLKTAVNVGLAYSDVADIARDAPVPASFGAYEMFVYKSKLLKQIEIYEDQSLVNYLKAIKIAAAYSLVDTQIAVAQNRIPRVLFLRGRCYDVLGTTLINDPPFPANADEAQRQEYLAQFEEVSLKYQENAVSVYENILEYAQQGQAAGDFVTQAYVRLFQIDAQKYGTKIDRPVVRRIASGPHWKCTPDSSPSWYAIDGPDSLYKTVEKVDSGSIAQFTGFPQSQPMGMWWGRKSASDTSGTPRPDRLFFRTTFYVKDAAPVGTLYIGAVDECLLYLNGKQLPLDTSAIYEWHKARVVPVGGQLREGKNVLAVCVKNNVHRGYGLYPLLEFPAIEYEYQAIPPGTTSALPTALVANAVYQFTPIKNFIMTPRAHAANSKGGTP